MTEGVAQARLSLPFRYLVAVPAPPWLVMWSNQSTNFSSAVLSYTAELSLLLSTFVAFKSTTNRFLRHKRLKEFPQCNYHTLEILVLFGYYACADTTFMQTYLSGPAEPSLARPDVPGKGNVWSLLPAFRDSMEFHKRDVTS